jgi:hypothetical protein
LLTPSLPSHSRRLVLSRGKETKETLSNPSSWS